MSERPAETTEPQGMESLLWIAVPCLLFMVRVGLWWRRWAIGKVIPSAMTGGEWFGIVFGHLAVVGGVVLLAMRLRGARSNRSGSRPM